MYKNLQHVTTNWCELFGLSVSLALRDWKDLQEKPSVLLQLPYSNPAASDEANLIQHLGDQRQQKAAAGVQARVGVHLTAWRLSIQASSCNGVSSFGPGLQVPLLGPVVSNFSGSMDASAMSGTTICGMK